jgi:hypothetical protein
MQIRKYSRSIGLLALAVACDGANDVCPALPCAAPFGVTVSIRSAAGLTIPTAFVQERDSLGTLVQSTDCGADLCAVGMHAGTYHLVIGAPGFVSRDTIVNVTAANTGRCSCLLLNTQRLAITLIVRAAGSS